MTRLTPTQAELLAVFSFADQLAAETGSTRDTVLAVLLWQAQAGRCAGFQRMRPVGTVRDAKPVKPVIEDPTTVAAQ